MEVKIYTTQTCSWCKKTKAFLKDNIVDFKEVDVTSDEAASEEMIEKSGQMGVPVIDVDGKIITGFNEDELKKVLKL